MSVKQKDVRNRALEAQQLYENSVSSYLCLTVECRKNYVAELEKRRAAYISILNELRELGVTWGPDFG